MAAQIIVNITPPKKLSNDSLLSPRSFLDNELAKPRLSERMSFNLSTSDSKSAKLVPSPLSQDLTMDAYHTRIKSLKASPDNLTVSFPISLMTSKYKAEIENLSTQLVEDRTRLTKLEITIKKMEQERIMSFGCNMLAKLFDKLENSCISQQKQKQNDATQTSVYVTSTKYTRAAQNLDQSKFMAITKLSKNCFKIAQSYPKLVATRNQWAHATEHEFAALLLKEEHQNMYFAWGPIFRFCFEKSIEEMVEQNREEDADIAELFGF